MLLLSSQFSAAGAVTLVQGSYWALFSLWISSLPPSLPPSLYFSPLISHCNGCLVLLMCMLMVGRYRFTCVCVVTSSRSYLC